MWYAHLGKPQQYPLKLSMCIVCALAVSLPGIYLTDSFICSQKTCTRIFTTLFIKPPILNLLNGYIHGRIKKTNFAETHALK